MPGERLVFWGGYHPHKKTFKTHPEHVFSKYEKYNLISFLHVFLNFSIMSFPKLEKKMTKSKPFSNFAPLNDVCTVHPLVLKNNPNYVIFLRGWYPTSDTMCPPPPPPPRIVTKQVWSTNSWYLKVMGLNHTSPSRLYFWVRHFIFDCFIYKTTSRISVLHAGPASHDSHILS